jgi:serine/threonine protein kinase
VSSPPTETPVLRDYEVAAPLAWGSSGVFYAGRHRLTGHPVALQRIAPHLAAAAGFVDRLGQAARRVAALRNPHVVGVYDLVVEDGVYLVLELVAGPSLRELVPTGQTMPPAAALAAVDDVLAALETAHAEGIVHGDIRPERVLVTPQGVAKLGGFAVSEALLVLPNHPGARRPGYSSPERLAGNAPDARADLYATAALASELMTGVAPSPGRVGPPALPDVAEVLRRALSPDASRRFAGATDLRAALVGAVSGSLGPSWRLASDLGQRATAALDARAATGVPGTSRSRGDASAQVGAKNFSPQAGARDFSPQAGARDFSPQAGANDFSPQAGANDFSPQAGEDSSSQAGAEDFSSRSEAIAGAEPTPGADTATATPTPRAAPIPGFGSPPPPGASVLRGTPAPPPLARPPAAPPPSHLPPPEPRARAAITEIDSEDRGGRGPLFWALVILGALLVVAGAAVAAVVLTRSPGGGSSNGPLAVGHDVRLSVTPQQGGCDTDFQFAATGSLTGQGTLLYRWERSDGQQTDDIPVAITDQRSFRFTIAWRIIGHQQRSGTMTFRIVQPASRVVNQTITYNCP